MTLHYSDDTTDYPVAFPLWRPADAAHIERGLVAAGIPLRAAKPALKTEAPDQWRNYLLALWRRKSDEPAVAALYAGKLNSAQHLPQR